MSAPAANRSRDLGVDGGGVGERALRVVLVVVVLGLLGHRERARHGDLGPAVGVGLQELEVAHLHRVLALDRPDDARHRVGVAAAVERGAGVVEVDAGERVGEAVGVALAPHLAVGDDVEPGPLLVADREQRRVVLRLLEPLRVDPPQLERPHAGREARGELLAVDEPVGLGVGADEARGKCRGHSRAVFRICAATSSAACALGAQLQVGAADRRHRPRVLRERLDPLPVRRLARDDALRERVGLGTQADDERLVGADRLDEPRELGLRLDRVDERGRSSALAQMNRTCASPFVVERRVRPHQASISTHACGSVTRARLRAVSTDVLPEPGGPVIRTARTAAPSRRRRARSRRAAAPSCARSRGSRRRGRAARRAASPSAPAS